jgi:hypothetical protein
MRWQRSPEGLDGEVPAVNNIMPEPAPHGWAYLLALVEAIRRLAYDRSLAPDDAMRRIQDKFGEYDGRFDDEDPRQAGSRSDSARRLMFSALRCIMAERWLAFDSSRSGMSAAITSIVRLPAEPRPSGAGSTRRRPRHANP